MLNKAPFSEDSDADQENHRNHGRRIDGFFKQGSDCQYFWMEWRYCNTLIRIVERECAHGSVIHSDERPAYRNQNAMGYQHSRVNHQQHNVHTVAGAHAQAIE